MTAVPDPEPPAIPKPWRLIAVSLVSFLVLGAATFLLPQNPYVRYQQLAMTLQYHSVWDFERIVYDKTPIDIAVIGNSRLESAISAPKLGAELSARLGRTVHVANLAQPQEGRNAHFVMFKNLIEHHPEVKLVIMSVIEQMPREGHPTFRYIADPLDVLGAPLFINANYVEDLSYQPYRQMSLFVEQTFPGAFNVHDRFEPALYAGPDLDTTVSARGGDGVYVDHDTIHTADELRDQAEQRIAKITPPLLPKWGEGAEFVVDRYYTKAIMDLASAHGVRVAFLFLPVFESSAYVRELGFYQQFGPVIDGRFLANDAGDYGDYGHLNHVGSGLFTRWLGDYVVDHHLMAPPVKVQG